MSHGSRTLIACVLMLSAAFPLQAEQDYVFENLAAQLDHLSNLHRVDIRGLEFTRSEPAVVTTGPLDTQVKSLLQNFNYVSIQDNAGGLERIIILGEKQLVPRGTTVKTETHGKTYSVNVSLTGAPGSTVDTSLVVDTGADFVVLPSSLMESLGLGDTVTEIHELQTANGVADAEVGTLAQLRIGNEIINSVAVAFIDDELLGGTRLLGMSVLNRFRVTLDSEKQTVTLIRTH